MYHKCGEPGKPRGPVHLPFFGPDGNNDAPFPITMDTPPSRPDDARRVVLVTGGSRGIGRAVCLEFGRAGWHVGVHYRDRRREAEDTAALVADLGGASLPLQADVRDHAQVERMVGVLAERWGRLDALVCGAAQTGASLVLRTDQAQWCTVVETNLTGTFHCLRAAAPLMLARRDGAVIILGSMAGMQGAVGLAAYAASKAGLLGLARTAAREWGPGGVRVNLLLPGWQQTELAGEAFPGPEGLKDHLLGRTVELEEVGRAVFHLALLRGASGQVWNLDSRPL